MSPVFFFFNDTATTEIYTLSLHDALPISRAGGYRVHQHEGVAQGLGRAFDGRSVPPVRPAVRLPLAPGRQDRKSTRLNSSHVRISYAVFCLKTQIRKAPTESISNE